MTRKLKLYVTVSTVTLPDVRVGIQGTSEVVLAGAEVIAGVEAGPAGLHGAAVASVSLFGVEEDPGVLGVIAGTPTFESEVEDSVGRALSDPEVEVRAKTDDESSTVLEVSLDSEPVDVCLVAAFEVLGIVEVAD